MKKNFIIGAIFLLLSFAVLLTACDIPRDLSDDVVRIHIRANSNSEIDQSVKLKVRDEVTEYLTYTLDGCETKKDALRRLNEVKDEIAVIANKALYDSGFDYKTTVSVKNDYFPERKYGDYVFPEGYYDALMIYLGEGVGDNWWCVAFPPLCFLPDDDGEGIEYKSWVKEKLDQIFG